MKEQVTTKGKGYLIRRPGLDNYPWVLGVQGSPYNMGVQQGFLLASLIRTTASGFLSPIFAQFGGWQPAMGTNPTLDQMARGRERLFSVYQQYFEPAIRKQAPDLLEEMEGLVNGLQKAGVAIPRQDILIGNCIPEITELQFHSSDQEKQQANGVESKGCSDCIVWGKATRQGHLIHGSNYDYATFNVLHKGIGVIIAKPDAGHPFLGQCLAGTVGHYRGMNSKGITVGEPTSESFDRDIKNNPRIPHAMHMRKLLQFSSSAEEAVSLMRDFKGTTGYNHAIGDSKTSSAVIIEASCNQLAVIRPREGQDAIWSANHCVSYPGFNGYEGDNLTKNQLRHWGIPWEDADSMEKWKAAIKEKTDKQSFSWQRYEKLEQLVKGAYGTITVDTMIDFLSTWPLTRDPEFKGQLSGPCEQLYGLFGPIFDLKLAALFSAVFDTGSMTAWVAAGAEPAQSGTYWPIRFIDYLHLMENSFSREEIPPVSAKEGKSDHKKSYGLTARAADNANTQRE